MKIKIKQMMKYVGFAAGTFLYAAAINLFYIPNGILTGGVTGIAIVAGHLTGLSVGALVLALNIPLFIAGYKYIGRQFFFTSAICTGLLSLFIDLAKFLPPFTDDILLSAIYGGVLGGAGLGLVYLCGSTTGGTDIMVRLLRRKFAHLPMGRLILALDAVIIISGIFVFGDINKALYSMIAIFVLSSTVDLLIHGSDKGNLIYIITKKHAEVAAQINQSMERGATLLYGQGAYSGEDNKVVITVIKPQQIGQLKAILKSVDPSAFYIVSDAQEIIGEGFKGMDHL